MSKPEGEASPYQPIYVEPAAPKSKSSQTRFNLHLIDNMLQAVCIVVCSFVGAMIGGVLGLMLGVLFGLFSSGIFIMIYRSRNNRSRRRSAE